MWVAQEGEFFSHGPSRTHTDKSLFIFFFSSVSVRGQKSTTTSKCVKPLFQQFGELLHSPPMTWYALQHKPAQGDRALQHLQNQEIPCFYPKITVEKVKAGKRTKKLEPLFPGYLFVNLEQTDPRWAKLRSTRGVLRIVGFANKPAAVGDDVIRHIRESLDTVAEQGGIKPGQAVELNEGPFEGISAIFEAYDGEERAIVLISFMQKQQRVTVPVSALNKP